MNFNVGINFGSQQQTSGAVCRFNHPLTLMSGRNAMCDKCRRAGLMTSYACVPCDFDLCDVCAMGGGNMNVNIGGGNMGSGTQVTAVCKLGHLLQMSNNRNAMCDVCRRSGLNPSYACIPCNFDMCQNCAMNNSNQGGMGGNMNMGGGMNVGTNITAVCRKNHPLQMATNRNAMCDVCRMSGLTMCYACYSCNFDMCPNCAQNNSNQGNQGGMSGGFGTNITAVCRMNHPLQMATNRNAMCDVCRISGLTMCYTCYSCNFDMCAACAKNNSNQGQGGFIGGGGMTGGNIGGNTGFNQNINVGFSTSVPTNRVVKFYDTNHGTHVFVGHGDVANDHQVYGCRQQGFQVQNFIPRTSLFITQQNNGDYQIMDQDHQSFLFVGNDLDYGGDHIVWSSAQKYWNNYNDFLYRTSWQIVPAENGCFRFLDKKHNSYLFLGNSNEGGDHTLYSVPLTKYNGNPNEWMRRTLFQIQ
ncbi:MAG: DC1 domain-containing protein [bacterium]|nr:DC1 domain-containing protein [bacterium]